MGGWGAGGFKIVQKRVMYYLNCPLGLWPRKTLLRLQKVIKLLFLSVCNSATFFQLAKYEITLQTI